MDEKASHGGYTGSLRVNFIYRFYASKPVKGLSYEDMKLMIADIHTMKGETLESHKLNELTKSTMTQIFGVQRNGFVPFDNFSDKVKNMKFRGTSTLFRSPRSIVEFVLGGPSVYSNVKQLTGPLSRTTRRKFYGPCINCRPNKKKELCQHYVRIDRDRYCDVAGHITDSASSAKSRFALDKRQFSNDILCNTRSEAQQILARLRKFGHDLKDSWRPPTGIDFRLDEVLNITKAVAQLFREEPRVVKVR